MGRQTKQTDASHPKKRITDEILQQIGRSVLLVFIIVAILAIFMVWWAIMSSKQTELTLGSESAVNKLNGFFDGYIQMVEELSVNPEIHYVLAETKPGDDILQTEKMDTVYQNLVAIAGTDTTNIMAVWISDLDASILTQSDGFTSEDGWDITGRAWYPCIAGGSPILTEPYIDSSSGRTIISVAAPVYDRTTGEALGAVGIDISLTHLMEIMGQYKVGSNGYIFLLSPNGTMVYHPQTEFIQQNIADINISRNVIDAVTTPSGQSEFLKYKANGVTKYGVVSHSEDTGFFVISNLPFLEYYSMLFIMLAALLIVFVAGLLMIVMSIRKSAKSLTKPILELNQTAQLIADGDLNVTLEITAEDEIGELGESIQRTITRLKEYIIYIDETAEVLGEIAEGRLHIELKHDYVGEFQKIKTALLNISSSMIEVMEGISETSEQVSIGATELANASEMLADGAQAQASSVEELVATAASVTEQVEENRKGAARSAQATDTVTEMINENQKKMTIMMNAMNEIQETSQQVVGIIQTIEEIASQTNLLSLNASIEAARAGEVGKGFAVVADEIGKLASESSKAASMTRDLIGVSMDEIRKGNNIAVDVMASLEESVKAVDHVNEMIKQTSENASVQAESMEQIRIGIEEISRTVQDTSATSQETSATSEELAAQASNLNDMVQKFTLN